MFAAPKFGPLFKADRFARDEKGAVAMVFALTLLGVMLLMACAVDYGRAITIRQKIATAADAAAILAAKRMKDGAGTLAEIEIAARAIFDADMTTAVRTAKVIDFKLTPTADKNGVVVDAKAQMPTAFARIAGIKTMDIGSSATAIFNQQNIEVGLQLDVTGSMGDTIGGEAKIDSLKKASKNLLDILLPSGGTGTTKVRVGLAPFAAGVNAGSYANAVAGGAAAGGCVYERRTSFSDNTDAVPTGSDALLTRASLPGAGACPGNAKVVALSDDKSMLVSTINGYTTSTSTAGHLGTSWAWYLMSPNWSSIWPAASKPAAYNDAGTLKFAILMTDGIYNTVGGTSGRDLESQKRAKDLCDAMKDRNIRIYTVGFIDTKTPASAADTLKYCASSSDKFYKAEDGAELDAAFKKIAKDIARLRLAK